MSSRRLITLGTFDGVHLGHQKLIRQIMALAGRLRLKPMVILFAEPPRFYFYPEFRMPLLSSVEERQAMLKRLGIQEVRVLRFDRNLAEMPHTRFFEKMLIQTWHAGGLVVGRDFAFGKGRKGDLSYLRQACQERDIYLCALPLVPASKRKISSSHIRELLLKGEVALAARFLGRPYSLSGVVIRGLGLGHDLGFPTANLKVPQDILIPRGIFHVQVSGALFHRPKPGACSIGTRPTLRRKNLALAVEVHIPGFSGDLYGRRLKIEFIRKIREEKRFNSLSALKRQILQDVQSIREDTPE